jgi:hypothetical protein
VALAGDNKKKRKANKSATTAGFIKDSMYYKKEKSIIDSNKSNASAVCACQVLQLRSNNEKLDNVILLAEKYIGGKMSLSARRNLKSMIEKEKSHMKNLFFDKIRIVEKRMNNDNCKTLLTFMQTRYSNLIVYNVLNAKSRK